MQGQSLLDYFTANPPDLTQRGHQKALQVQQHDEAFTTLGEKMLNVPRPAQSAILNRKSSPNASSPGNVSPQQSKPLVSPLLWVPGLLRLSGSWTVSMNEAIQNEPFVDQLATEQNENRGVDNDSPSAISVISSFEKVISRQKALNDQLVHRYKTQFVNFQRELEKIRCEEREKFRKETDQTLRSSHDLVEKMRQELKTIQMASRVRVRRAYAQDNFSSTYSKAMLTIKDQARTIAKRQLTKLEDQVGALTRRVAVDTEYKRTLLRRMEAAELAAEKRWQMAEEKIPLLEEKIHLAQGQAEKVRLADWGETSKLKRNVERSSAELVLEKEKHEETKRLNQELRQELKEMEVKWRTEKLRVSDLRKSIEFQRTRNLSKQV